MQTKYKKHTVSKKALIFVENYETQPKNEECNTPESNGFGFIGYIPTSINMSAQKLFSLD